MNRFLTVFAALVLLISCAEDRKNSIQLIEYQGIRGQAVDAETGLGMPARIAIRDSTNNIVDSYYDHAPGLFTAEDGLFEKELPAGKYTMEVFHGIDYLSTKMNLEIYEGEGIRAKIYLQPWFDLRKRGWINGDGHCHLYTDKKPDEKMTSLVRKMCPKRSLIQNK